MHDFPFRTSILATVALSGCWWTAPPNDAGDEAFVAQAVEAILGRKPRGAAEIRALTDLAAGSGREAVVDALFGQPDYVAYWSQVLADDLQIQRADAMQVDSNCTMPALLPARLSGALADHLATAPPDEEFCVWTSRQFEVRPADLEAALDLALGEYEGTLPADLDEPEPMKQVPQGKSPDGPGSFVPGSSKEPPIEGQGGRSNGDFISYDGTFDYFPPASDVERWLDRQDRALHEECPPFNLTDVVEAAVRADRLDALYRAYLPVLATFPGAGDDASMRQDLGGMFLDVYLDRDPTCMGCHTATYSKTDARPLNANWDRFDPIWYGLALPIDAEGTVFSYDLGDGDFVYGGDGGEAVRERVGALFRADNHTGGGLRPWGIDEACVTNPARGFDGFEPALPSDPLGQTAAFANVGPSDAAGVLDLVTALSDGTRTFHELAFRAPDWAAYRDRRPSNGGVEDPVPCTFCHEPPGGSTTGDPTAPLLRHKVPRITDQRLFSIVRFGSGAMRPIATTDEEGWDYVRWVRDNYPESPAVQMTAREHGFVFLLGANVVDQIVDEVLGEDLVMLHGFSRNPDQARALSTLAMALGPEFSLRAVLKEIVLSDGFNRRPPKEPETEPYVLPMLPYPEAELSPASTERPVGADANSEGDVVHRHGPAGLLHQVHSALGWPPPHIAEDASVWPTASLSTSIGRYTSRRYREASQLGLATYMAWETEVATCRKPEQVYARDVALLTEGSADPWTVLGPDEWVDWIDVLVKHHEERGDGSWAELASEVKDRLLADPTLTKSELAAIAALWELDDLSGSPLEDGQISEAEEGDLRDFCGVLLASPDFLLRGLRLAPSVPDDLPDPVCLPDEICGADALYAWYEGAVPKEE